MPFLTDCSLRCATASPDRRNEEARHGSTWAALKARQIIRVALLTPDPLVEAGLPRMLESDRGMTIVPEGRQSRTDAVVLATEMLSPDIMPTLRHVLPGGAEAAQQDSNTRRVQERHRAQIHRDVA